MWRACSAAAPKHPRLLASRGRITLAALSLIPVWGELMASVTIRVAHLCFTARFEEAAAPRTCSAFRALMPFSRQLIQTRWSGEAAWVPMGELDLGLPQENSTSHP